MSGRTIHKKAAGIDSQGGKIEGGLRSKGIYKTSSPDKPLISVVTVARNSASMLRKTVESVINQTYKNIEYIIVDGASTDSTLDVIREYEASIDYWISEKDNGVYHGMNKAIDLAQGDWINFMNAGDYFYKPDVIQQIVADCSQEVDFIYGHHIYEGSPAPTEAAEFETLWQQLKNKKISNMWMGGFPCHQSLFSRARVLKKYKYNTKYKFAAEQDFLLSAYANGHQCLKRDMVVSIYARGGFSYKYQVKSLMERWHILRKFQRSFQINVFFIRRIFRTWKTKRVIKNSSFANCFVQGWYSLESNSSGWWYWTNKRGVISIPADKEAEYILEMELMSVKQPNEVGIYLNNKRVSSVNITWNGFKKIDPIAVGLVKGVNNIECVSQEEPTAASSERRLLAIAVKNLKIK